MSEAPITEFPLPGEAAFERLPPDERLWVQMVLPWFRKGLAAPIPERVREHPTMDLFRQDLAYHLPLLVKYYCAAPRLFGMALSTLTHSHVTGATAAETHDAWRRLIAA